MNYVEFQPIDLPPKTKYYVGGEYGITFQYSNIFLLHNKMFTRAVLYLFSVSIQTSLVTILTEPGPLAARAGILLTNQPGGFVAIQEHAVVSHRPSVRDAYLLDLLVRRVFRSTADQ